MFCSCTMNKIHILPLSFLVEIDFAKLVFICYTFAYLLFFHFLFQIKCMFDVKFLFSKVVHMYMTSELQKFPFILEFFFLQSYKFILKVEPIGP